MKRLSVFAGLGPHRWRGAWLACGILVLGCERAKLPNLKLPRHPADTLWVEHGAEPETLDPALCNESVGASLVDNLFAGLVALDPVTGEVAPDLADRWEINETQTRYLFHLRKAHWSDRTRITATDVVFSWERILDPALGSKNRALLESLQGSQSQIAGARFAPSSGVSALSEDCFEVRLARPVPYFLSLVAHTALKPVPRHHVLKFSTTMTPDAWTDPQHCVTSGPFQITSWRFKHRIDLKKSETYWDKKAVRLKSISLFMVEDASTARLMYLSGELDWLGLNSALPAQTARLEQDNSEFFQEPMLSTYFYWLNLRALPLAARKVREALSLSIDRQTLVDRVLQNGAIATDRLVPPGLFLYPPLTQPTFDPVRARALLAEAGYSSTKPLVGLSIAYNSDPSHRQIAEAIQEMWRVNLGIYVALDTQEWRVFLETLQTHQFTIARMGWVSDYLDPQSFLHDLFSTSSGNNPSGIELDGYDSRIAQANLIKDSNRRAQVLASIEAFALREFAMLPLFVPTHSMLIKPYVRGVRPNLLGRHPFKHLFIQTDIEHKP